MKTIGIAILSLLCAAALQAQLLTQLDKESLTHLKIGQHGPSGMDTRQGSFLALNLEKPLPQDTVYNRYGGLRDDNPALNPTYPLWTVFLKVTMANVVTFAIDRYILNYGFSRVGFNSWKHNLTSNWEWDTDRFGMNFIVHPYSGSGFFNAARSSGYNFWESAPFATFGSLEWEYFGENTLPSYNDLINTTIDGIFLGEATYRLGSDILDDRTTGMSRFLREFSVFVLSPTRAFSRFTQGKMFRVTSEDAYQTEPLNVTLSSGMRAVNVGSSFLTGPTNFMLNIHLDYGNPFEVRSRKPFDVFKLRMDFTKGDGRKILDNITGYGLLTGTTTHSGDEAMLSGIFQHFDYFDNKTFELATFAFGPGIMTVLPVGPTSNLYTNIHVAIVPFGANSTRFGPDTLQLRDYNYGGGAEAKLECTLNVGSWVNLTFVGFYYWFHTYVGYPGDHYIGLIKPQVTVRLFNNLSVGVEDLVYYSDRYTRDYGTFHQVRTEQRAFLSLYFENFKQEKQ